MLDEKKIKEIESKRVRLAILGFTHLGQVLDKMIETAPSMKLTGRDLIEYVIAPYFTNLPDGIHFEIEATTLNDAEYYGMGVLSVIYSDQNEAELLKDWVDYHIIQTGKITDIKKKLTELFQYYYYKGYTIIPHIEEDTDYDYSAKYNLLEVDNGVLLENWLNEIYIPVSRRIDKA